MTATTPIAVTGAAGRMGRMLIDMVTGSPAAALVAVTEAPGHPWIGRDLANASAARRSASRWATIRSRRWRWPAR